VQKKTTVLAIFPPRYCKDEEEPVGWLKAQVPQTGELGYERCSTMQMGAREEWLRHGQRPMPLPPLS